MSTKWYVVATAFHGGGISSRHRSEAAAEKAASKHRGTCTCGCVGVISAEDYENLRTADKCTSPYALAR